jgi:hypothetical protein
MANDFDIKGLRGHLRIAMSHVENSIRNYESVDKERARLARRVIVLEDWIKHYAYSPDNLTMDVKDILLDILSKNKTYWEEYKESNAYTKTEEETDGR